MHFTIGDKRYRLTREDVVKKMRNVQPDTVDGRNKYFVELSGRPYPIKQIVREATGMKALDFTSQDANRVLAKLGFHISNCSRSTREIANDDGDSGDGDLLKLLVTFETDEDGWVTAGCPTLPGCHSQGRTREEALANVREAIRGYLASMREHGEPLPPSSDFQVVEVAA